MKPKSQPAVEICILAGGLSQRMGRDKSRLKIGRRTMLCQIRATAKKLGLPVRVIRRDAVRRCGPLGGIYTALKGTKAEAVMFLACDMPFVTEKLLRTLWKNFRQLDKALFVYSADGAGFSFILRTEALTTVIAQIEQHQFSLQQLAQQLKAKKFNPPLPDRTQLRNINTPAELAEAQTGARNLFRKSVERLQKHAE